MASDNNVKIVIAAEDKTASAFSAVNAGLANLGRGAASAASAVAGLAGLGGAISAAGMAAMVKTSIDAADALNDLSQRIGINVEALAKYELAASQSGTSMEAIARGVKGLAANMLEHGAALKAAGVTAKEADGALRQLSDIFAAMPDGMEKAALATKLFGKAGMDLIPMLNMGGKGLEESAEKSARYAEAMAALAPKADEFNDRIAMLGLNAKATAAGLANQLMPVLDVVADGFTSAEVAGRPLAELMGTVFVESLKAVLVVGGNVGYVIKALGTEMGGLAAQIAAVGRGDFSGAAAIRDAMVKDAEAARKSIDAWSERVVNAGSSNASAAKEVGKGVGDISASAARGKALLASLGNSAKSAADEFAALMSRINAKESGLDTGFWKDIETLNAGYRQGRVTADEYAGAVRALTNQQKFAQDAAKAVADAEEAVAKAREKSREEAASALKNVQEEIEKQRQHNAEIGLTAAQLAVLTDERMAEAIATEEQAFARARLDGADLAELKLIDEKIVAMRELRQLRADGAARQAVADSARAAADDLEKFSDDLKRAATDGLMRGFEAGGKDGAKVAVDAIRNSLKTAAFKIVVDPVVNTASAAIGQMFGVGGSPGGAGSSGGMNLLSMADPSKWVGMSPTDVWGTLGDSYKTFSNLAESGMGMFDSAKIALDGTGKAFGNLAGYASAVFDMANGSYGNGIGTAVGTMFGGPVGGMIGSFIGDKVLGDDLGGLVQKAGGPQQGQYGTLNSKGYTSAYTMSGGDTLQNEALSKLAYGQAATLLAMAGKSAAGLTIGQGYKLDPQGSAAGLAYRNISLDGRTIAGGTFDGNNGAQWTGGNADAAGAAAYLSKLTTAEIKALVDAIGDSGLSDTIAKISANFTDLNAGLTQYLTAQAQQKSLVAAMMTDEEAQKARLEAANTSLAGTFAELGQAVPTSTAGFRALVEGLDLTTAAGQETLAKLSGVSDAFMTVAAAAKATEQERLGWQQKADILEGKYTQTQLERFMQLAGASDEATKALMRQVWALEDQKQAALDSAAASQVAADKARAVADKQRDLDIQLLDATGQTAAAIAARRADVLASLDNDMQRSTQLQIWAAQDAAAAAEASAKAQIDASNAASRAAEEQSRTLDQARQQMQNFADSLTKFRDSLSTEGASATASYAAAYARLTSVGERAALGDVESLGNLQGVSQDFLGSAKSQARDRSGYLRDVAKVRGYLDGAIRTASNVAGGADGNNAAVVAAVEKVVAAISAMSRDTRKTADLLIRVTRDGESLLTTTA